MSATTTPELIVMLTYDDKTVADAWEIFQACRDLPVRSWGFKNVGLDRAGMSRLAGTMKDAGRTVYLEVVSLDERSALEAVQAGSECGCDVLMGTVYSDNVRDAARAHELAYFPFVGQVSGHPSVLSGSTEEITDHARALTESGVDGLDLLSYRHDGDPALLLSEVVEATHVPVVSAGSIESYGRIDAVWNAGAWGFTIGSAFFHSAFEPNASFRTNLANVLQWLAQAQQNRAEPTR